LAFFYELGGQFAHALPHAFPHNRTAAGEGQRTKAKQQTGKKHGSQGVLRALANDSENTVMILQPAPLLINGAVPGRKPGTTSFGISPSASRKAPALRVE
jgi:hypothetical protein